MKRLFAALSIIILGLLILCNQLLFPPSFSIKEAIAVTIPPGSSIIGTAKILKRNGVIKSPRFFRLYTKLTGADRKIRAGTFRLSENYSLTRTVITLTTESGISELIKVTIPEGYTIDKIGHTLEKSQIVDHQTFTDYMATSAKPDFIQKHPFLELAPTQNLEGYVFPDTYFFSKKSSAKSVANAFFDQFEKKIVPLWEAAEATKGSPKKRFNFHKVLTMASIIEKEARHAFEQPKISSVFYNRLKKMMPMAADPTVVYALGLNRKALVTYKDTKVTSPYNTYQNAGFPPTPIASPGVSAFKAALAPLKTPYFFFVANPDGTHTFTKTYAEHLRVQRKKKR